MTAITMELDSAIWEKLPFWTKVLYKFLNDITTRRMKRMIFTSSLTGIFNREIRRANVGFMAKLKSIFFTSQIDKIITIKLNTVLNLKEGSSGSLVLPMIVSSFIWKKLSRDPTVTIDDKKIDITDIVSIKSKDPTYEYLTAFLLSQTPIWLIYGSHQALHHDIYTILDKVLK